LSGSPGGPEPELPPPRSRVLERRPIVERRRRRAARRGSAAERTGLEERSFRAWRALRRRNAAPTRRAFSKSCLVIESAPCGPSRRTCHARRFRGIRTSKRSAASPMDMVGGRCVGRQWTMPSSNTSSVTPQSEQRPLRIGPGAAGSVESTSRKAIRKLPHLGHVLGSLTGPPPELPRPLQSQRRGRGAAYRCGFSGRARRARRASASGRDQ
jgi:hypothetical protein